MDLRLLREFVICAQTGNFTKAADILYISQSVLSKHISRLESELGTPLFIRTKPLTLTRAGAYLLSKTVPLLEQCRSIFQETSALGKGYCGNLGFGILYYTKEVILPAISKFTQEYPDINLHYQFSTPNEIVRAVINRSVDIACIQRLAFPFSEPLAFHDLHQEPFILMCSPQSRLASKAAVSVTELKSEKYINVDDDFYVAHLAHINQRLSRYGVEMRPKALVKNFEELLMAVRLNQGVSIQAEAISKVDLGLKYLPFVEEGLDFQRALVFRQDRSNPNVDHFIHSLA